MKKDFFPSVFGKIRDLIGAAMVAVIRLYQRYLSPLLPPSCRFVPTCSEYTAQAILKYGPIKGFFLGCWRILRCNPFCKGGADPLK